MPAESLEERHAGVEAFARESGKALVAANPSLASQASSSASAQVAQPKGPSGAAAVIVERPSVPARPALSTIESSIADDDET
eukprot:3378363-Pyramimonas_sp.AAC.1